jgi:tRNA A58 N-methylase Trm61
MKQIRASSDAKDTVTVDVPLLIRLLEHAREDVKDDAQLHVFVEGIVDISKKVQVLTMQHWPDIIKTS